ncbi:MAG: MarR family winged helix-turn-helix transcriptional regulator [Dehalococcoidia bacterium]
MMAETTEHLERAVSVFSQAARLLDGPRLHAWDERGLTLPQLRILFRVRQEPGIGVKELAQAFDVSTSNVTQQVDKLVTRGLLARAERPADRRQVSLTVTEEGSQVAGEISLATRGYLREQLARMEPDDLDTLVTMLGRLLAHATPPAPSTVNSGRRG